MEEGEDVLEGVLLMLKYLGIPKCVIGIEKNKPKAIEKMTRLCEKHDNITVKALKSSYPQGAEKTLIFSTTGRVVKEGTLPLGKRLYSYQFLYCGIYRTVHKNGYAARKKKNNR